MMRIRFAFAARLLPAAFVVGLGLVPLVGEAALDPDRNDRAGHVGSSVRAEQWEVRLEAAALKVGQPGAIVVTIAPKAGFKFNEQFPTRLTVDAPPDGLTFPAPSLKKTDGKLEANGTFTFRMPVQASRAGEFPVQTTLRFSVCNADKCVIQRQVLAASLTAT